MKIWFHRWLNDLSFEDPIEQQQAPLLQTLLLIFLIMNIVSAPLTLVRPDRAEQIHGTVVVLLYIVVTAAALWVLRHGRFQLAVIIAATGFVLLMADRFIAVGLTDNPVHLLSAAIPIVLAGLLGKRGTLLWIAGLSMVLVGTIGLQPLLPSQPPLGVVERSILIRAIVGFMFITVILVALVDRFGGSLRRALGLALLRKQELEQLRSELENTVADRTAELRATNADLQRAKRTADNARRVAEEANHFKTQFLANMSHELRTPLNAIINFTDFLGAERYGTLSERQQELQQRVLGNAEHLLGLINDILDLAKIEAGRMELFREPTNLTHILRGVMATTAGLTRDKGLELHLELPDELPEICIDKTRIRQVLLNLLSNAAKFTEQGSISVRVSLDERPSPMIRIEVADTGIGIAPEQQHLVFEEFRQVDGELTRQHQGSGLGMPISKHLVEMHGGQMSLQSQPGVGSTFCFTLPLQMVAHIPAPPEQHAPKPALLGLSVAPLVVVVDDEPVAQQILYHHLSDAGYTVRIVGDSREALATIELLQPKLVILDLQMPQKDGWQVLTELRMTPTTADIPVVLCSILDEQRLGLALGANDYLVKPVRAERLLPMLRRWLDPSSCVLVIDDERESRQILRAILEQAQHTVCEADSGRSGLALLETTTPKLIVLDLMMPELDGFEVLARLRADPRYAELPVIVVTAKDLTVQEHAWLRERAQLALQKSHFTPGEFVAQLHAVIRKESINAS